MLPKGVRVTHASAGLSGPATAPLRCWRRSPSFSSAAWSICSQLERAAPGIESSIAQLDGRDEHEPVVERPTIAAAFAAEGYRAGSVAKLLLFDRGARRATCSSSASATQPGCFTKPGRCGVTRSGRSAISPASRRGLVDLASDRNAVAERPVLRAADRTGRPHRLRAVRAGPDEARPREHRRRDPDADVAGLQLPRRRRQRHAGHLVRGRHRSTARLIRPFENRGVPAALQLLRRAVPALDRAQPLQRRLPQRPRPAALERRATRDSLRPAHLRGPPRVRDGARVRRRHPVPRPRRQPHVPLREHLLLEDHDRGRRDDAALPVARARPARGGARRRRVLGLGLRGPRRRPLDHPRAPATSWIFRGPGWGRARRSRSAASRRITSPRRLRAASRWWRRSRTCSPRVATPR